MKVLKFNLERLRSIILLLIIIDLLLMAKSAIKITSDKSREEDHPFPLEFYSGLNPQPIYTGEEKTLNFFCFPTKGEKNLHFQFAFYSSRKKEKTLLSPADVIISSSRKIIKAQDYVNNSNYKDLIVAANSDDTEICLDFQTIPTKDTFQKNIETYLQPMVILPSGGIAFPPRRLILSAPAEPAAE